jgi:hypothetical protein
MNRMTEVEGEEDRKMLSLKSITRKQKLKDLMIHRTSIEQGLTFRQILCEVYCDIVEKYAYRNPDLGRSELDLHGGDILSAMDYNGEYGKIRYLRRMIKQVRKTDDEFRWLSILPVKRNEVDKTTGKKVRPYLEYKYINIKASRTHELLERVNAIWLKHLQACNNGLESKLQRLQAILERITTKEGQREHMIAIKALSTEIKCKITYLNVHDEAKTLDKVISELKDEGRIPRQYRTNYTDISKVLTREIVDRRILQHMMRQMPDTILYDDDKTNEEIRRAIKDIIVSSFDIRQFEKEQMRNSKTTERCIPH